MNRIRIGCETYTWQMPGEQYKDKLGHIMQIMSQAGFDGFEPEGGMSIAEHDACTALQDEITAESGCPD